MICSSSTYNPIYDPSFNTYIVSTLATRVSTCSIKDMDGSHQAISIEQPPTPIVLAGAHHEPHAAADGAAYPAADGAAHHSSDAAAHGAAHGAAHHGADRLALGSSHGGTSCSRARFQE